MEKSEKRCRHCREFFARFRCGRNVGDGECDCPKCQGYCECEDYWTQQNPPDEPVEVGGGLPRGYTLVFYGPKKK